MLLRAKWSLALTLPLLLCQGGPAQAAAFADPLNAAAFQFPAPAVQPLMAITHAGDHLVAVGPDGLIIVSRDLSGNAWRQANVPVQSDLVAVQFVNAKTGWACGHDGVILHTDDGGVSWTKQLDGVMARQIFEAYYENLAAAHDPSASAMLQQVRMNFDPGPILPWLGLVFPTPQTGYAVGAFGDVAATSNGGKTWQPWLEHVDNPGFLDLNAIGDVGGTIYMVGEQGSVFTLDPTDQEFVARPTGYSGSLFGLTGTAHTLVVFGLRGTILRSEDQGKTWTQSSSPSESSIMSGTVLADGRFVLVNVDGHLLISKDDAKTFALSSTNESMPLTDVTLAGRQGLVVTGLGGFTHVQDQ